jgi:CRP-like cAMP-binding protein
MSLLSHIRLLADLPTELLERLERNAALMEPRHDAEIFAQGAKAEAVYAIVGGEGCVRIGSVDRRGKRLMVEIFGKGDMFGEVGVLDGGRRTASACTEGRVRLLRIEAGPFLAAINEAPALGLALARSLSTRLRRTFTLFEAATFETLEVRLARQLLHLADNYSRPTDGGIVLTSRMRQEGLADLLGTTTRSIITILNNWRRAGMVAYDTDTARITICNERAMRSLIDVCPELLQQADVF